jgi:signal transduction histidine kinase
MNSSDNQSPSSAENSRIAAQAGIFYDEITVQTDEINREMHQKTKHYLNLLIWTALFLYPLFTFLDFVFIEQFWLEFLVIRVVLLAGVYILYDYSSQKDRWLLAPVHLLLAGIGLQMVSFAVLAPVTAFYYYILAWTVTFVAINLIMLWQPYNGLLQLFWGIGAFFGINYLFSPHPIALLVEYGGMFFMVTATISIFVPAVRYEYESRKVAADIFRRKANLRLEQQVAEIVRQKELVERRGAELKRFNDQKTRYLNISTHGIKNPINGILGLIELIKIQYEDLPEELLSMLTDIENAAVNINEVVDQYLNVQAIEQDDEDLYVERFDFTEISNDIVETMQRDADDRYITISYLKPSRELPIFANKAALKQALGSLMKYALRLSHNNSELKVMLEQEGHKVRCHISQAATTVEYSELEEMFNKLEQLTEEGKSAKSSTGVGLSLSRQLLRRMQATLYYSSNKQTGLYFLVEFNYANLSDYNEITY